MKALSNLQEEHLSVHFKKNYLKEEKQICDVTDSIRKAFKRSFEFIQTIQGNSSFETNARNSLRYQLNILNTEFTTLQMEYSESKQKLKINSLGLKQRKQKIVSMSMNSLEDEMFNGLSDQEKEEFERLQMQLEQKGLEEAQRRKVLQNQREILERDRELKGILESIQDIQIMFQDLDRLIKEQQVSIDQIDKNLDETEDHVVIGKDNLKSAESYQSYTCLLM